MNKTLAVIASLLLVPSLAFAVPAAAPEVDPDVKTSYFTAPVASTDMADAAYLLVEKYGYSFGLKMARQLSEYARTVRDLRIAYVRGKYTTWCSANETTCDTYKAAVAAAEAALEAAIISAQNTNSVPNQTDIYGISHKTPAP